MHILITLLLIGVSTCLLHVQARHPSQHHSPPQTIIIKPPMPSPTVAPVPSGSSGTCPAPSEEMIKCIRQWACQYIIRLDLRCLLNLNGNPLLGGVLGGGSGTPAVGGGGGGILGGILGL